MPSSSPMALRAQPVPGALARLRRRRLAVVGTLMLAVFATGAGQMRESSTIQLQESVDANWRGAFDILVRPSGQRLHLEDTAGLVEPNYVSFAGAGGITLDQLAMIRELPDVEVAAPIGMVGNMQYLAGGPVVAGVERPEAPTLYELTIRAITSDGLSEILVQEEKARALLLPTDDSGAAAPVITDSGSVSWDADGFMISFAALPPIASPLMAVDPEAEMQLLGPSFDFLAPLARNAQTASQPIALDFDTSLIPAAFEGQSFFIMALTTDRASPAARRPVIPVAVSSTLYAPLTVTVEVVQIGDPLAVMPHVADVRGQLDLAAELAGGSRTSLGVSEHEVSQSLRPFQPPRLNVVWPGSRPPESEGASIAPAGDLMPQVVLRPHYEQLAPREGSTRPAYAPATVGLVDSSGVDRRADEARVGSVVIGLETAFRESGTAALPILDGYVATGPLDRPFAFAPLSEFTLGNLLLPDNPLNYVPLGAYAAPETTLVAGADGIDLPPTQMTPTLNPRGLIAMPPLALTDLRSAATLRGEAPIDAIRVRLRGIERFDPASVSRVERVATTIAGMGLAVDIVAGSSPQAVELLLRKLDAAEQPSLVGWVEQDWTTLGAAQQLVRGLGSANFALLLLSAIVAITFAIGMELVGREVRASEIAVLKALGWSRRRITTWVVGETAWAGGIVFVAGLGIWLLAGRTGFTGPSFALGLALLLPVSTYVAVRAGVAGSTTLTELQANDIRYSTASFVREVTGPVSYALRAAWAYPARSLTTGISIGIAAGAAASGLATIAETAAAVGPTRLAGALSSTLGPFHIAMLVAAIFGSATLAMTLVRVDAQARRSEMSILRACGWTRLDILRLLFVQRLAVGTLASVAAVIATGLLTAALTGVPHAVAMALAPVAIAATLVIDALWGAR